ncbi:MAG: ATP-binding protein [Planctomycetota bacterium]
MSEQWAWTVETTLPSRRGAHLPLMDEILQHLGELGWDGRDYFGVQMALEESLSNAIRHGNKLDDSKVVRVECKVHADRFWIRVEDEGQGFQPAEVADCRSAEGLEAAGGRGMLLIEAYMTSVEHNPRGNCITMAKVRGED